MATNSVKIGIGVVAGAVAVSLAFLLGRSVVDAPEESSAGATTSSSTASTGNTAGLVEFRDEKAGWAISYPKAWNRLEPKDTDVALVVSEKPAEQNTGGSILARDLTLAGPVNDGNLAAAKEVTDGIVTGEGIQHITEPTVVRQAGLPGYFYFYSFKDPASGQEGVHSHYFLFKESTMISFVFQALPKGEFQRLANLYDEVIASFKVL
ncbi:MAG TPA: hypothetical protein VJS45_15220 [Acidimicrobiia bacterium]|nr:hypothetical protein [Acidimicrobiia bacterium]